MTHRRGGRRQRRARSRSGQAARWGPRLARVKQCVTLADELVYDKLLRDGEALVPGWCAMLTWAPNGSAPGATPWYVDAEVLANAVWRHGRLFLQCPACRRLATRLYVPLVGVQPLCRRCWGLSYESRSWSYKATGFLGRAFGPVAYVTTICRREERQATSRVRYAARRAAKTSMLQRLNNIDEMN